MGIHCKSVLTHRHLEGKLMHMEVHMFRVKQNEVLKT